VVESTELIGQTLSNINTEATASENQARDIQGMILEHVMATSEISNSIEQVRQKLKLTEKESATASEQAMKLFAISETIYNDLSIFNLGSIHDDIKKAGKRLFQGPTGILCGSHTQEFLLQTYKCDTGEILHDLSAPIYVNGQHWGAIRMGYKAESAH